MNSAGLVVTSPVMEVNVTSLIPSRSSSQILPKMLQAQILECDTNSATKSQQFEYYQTLNSNKKITSPQIIDQNSYY